MGVIAPSVGVATGSTSKVGDSTDLERREDGRVPEGEWIRMPSECAENNKNANLLYTHRITYETLYPNPNL